MGTRAKFGYRRFYGDGNWYASAYLPEITLDCEERIFGMMVQGTAGAMAIGPISSWGNSSSDQTVTGYGFGGFWLGWRTLN